MPEEGRAQADLESEVLQESEAAGDAAAAEAQSMGASPEAAAAVRDEGRSVSYRIGQGLQILSYAATAVGAVGGAVVGGVGGAGVGAAPGAVAGAAAGNFLSRALMKGLTRGAVKLARLPVVRNVIGREAASLVIAVATDIDRGARDLDHKVTGGLSNALGDSAVEGVIGGIEGGIEGYGKGGLAGAVPGVAGGAARGLDRGAQSFVGYRAARWAGSALVHGEGAEGAARRIRAAVSLDSHEVPAYQGDISDIFNDSSKVSVGGGRHARAGWVAAMAVKAASSAGGAVQSQGFRAALSQGAKGLATKAWQGGLRAVKAWGKRVWGRATYPFRAAWGGVKAVGKAARGVWRGGKGVARVSWKASKGAYQAARWTSQAVSRGVSRLKGRPPPPRRPAMAGARPAGPGAAGLRGTASGASSNARGGASNWLRPFGKGGRRLPRRVGRWGAVGAGLAAEMGFGAAAWGLGMIAKASIGGASPAFAGAGGGPAVVGRDSRVFGGKGKGGGSGKARAEAGLADPFARGDRAWDVRMQEAAARRRPAKGRGRDRDDGGRGR